MGCWVKSGHLTIMCFVSFCFVEQGANILLTDYGDVKLGKCVWLRTRNYYYILYLTRFSLIEIKIYFGQVGFFFYLAKIDSSTQYQNKTQVQVL